MHSISFTFLSSFHNLTSICPTSLHVYYLLDLEHTLAKGKYLHEVLILVLKDIFGDHE